jgi:hypothetical protein
MCIFDFFHLDLGARKKRFSGKIGRSDDRI